MAKNKCTLFVRDVDIMARVGIFAPERRKKTRLNITLEITCKRKHGRGTDETIADLISYGDMVAMVKDTVNSGHFDLIETLADAILDEAHKDKRAVSMKVTIEKIGAYAPRKDLLTGVGCVGVVMERRR